MLRVLGALLLALVIAAGTLGVVRFWPPTPLPEGIKADKVLVLKGEQRLVLLSGGAPIKSYPVALGWSPKGPKTRQGDGKTPEGTYKVDYRNAASGFYRALHVSYPNGQDRAKARKLGVSPGGAIMIHGIKNGFGWVGPLHRFVNWTDGCIAVTDEEIREIWSAVPDGTPIEIRP